MEDESNRKELTRREFLKGVGAGSVVATGVTLGSPALASPASKLPKKWDYETDVVVVGYGAAGAAAAVEAREAGAKVIILEKMPKGGGNTANSGGTLLGAGTDSQKKQGVEDSPEELYKFLMAVGGEYVDPDLIKTFADNAGKSIEWLHSLGLQTLYVTYVGVEGVPDYAQVVAPKQRGHKQLGGGRMVYAVLREAAQDSGAKVLLDMPAQELIATCEGEVVGVKAGSPGKEKFIRARKAVVLTTGGMSRNKEMLKDFCPYGYESVPTGALGNTGDGIRMAQALGADLLGLFNAGGVPTAEAKPNMLTFYVPEGFVSQPSPCVIVNKEGKRFINETGGYTFINIEIQRQKGNFAWSVFDEKVRQGHAIAIRNNAEGLAWSQGMKEEIEQGIVIKGETFGELAQKLNIDRETFENTMNEYNKNAKLGKDPEFGKQLVLSPIETAPFYAIKTRSGILENFGGARIDTQARVLDVSKKVIPRLYAAGMHNTGGFVGKILPSSGMSINVGIVFGRIAGRNAAREKAI